MGRRYDNIRKMFNSFNNPTQTRGGIVNNPDFKWPNGIVYYKFDSAISKTTKEHIQQAMDEWKQSTSKIITFTERTSQKNYIKFINVFRSVEQPKTIRNIQT